MTPRTSFRMTLLLLSGILMRSPAFAQGDVMIAGLYSAPPAVVNGLYPSLARCLTVSRDGGATWSSVGWRAHRTWDLLCLGGRTDTVFTASDYGVLRSVDGMNTWVLVSPRRLTLARSFARVGTELWVATARGAWKSTDGGATWTEASEGLPVRYTSTLLVLPGVSRLLVGTEDGLFVREPGAKAWTRFALAGQPITRLVGGDAENAPLLALSDTKGLWVSRDGGRTWTDRGAVLPTRRLSCAVLDPRDPKVLLLGSEDMGPLRSTDGGETWTLTGGGMSNFTVTSLLRDPRQPDRVYAGMSNGTYLSEDGGRSWTPFTLSLGYVSTLQYATGGRP